MQCLLYRQINLISFIEFISTDRKIVIWIIKKDRKSILAHQFLLNVLSNDSNLYIFLDDLYYINLIDTSGYFLIVAFYRECLECRLMRVYATFRLLWFLVYGVPNYSFLLLPANLIFDSFGSFISCRNLLRFKRSFIILKQWYLTFIITLTKDCIIFSDFYLRGF
jgi:hypothetical protein